MLENTRFHPEEEKNEQNMAMQLASLAEVFVNDAFGTAHRAHASTEGVTRYLPAVSGFLLEKEIQYLGQAIADPKRPFVAILGGAKISDKIGVIKNLLDQSRQGPDRRAAWPIPFIRRKGIRWVIRWSKMKCWRPPENY